jgi:TolA-binding protein
LFHRELLNGRLELAKAAQVTDADNAAQELRRSALARFQKVIDESQLPLTRGQARMELAHAHRQAGSFLQAANVLEPLIKQNRSLASATGLLPAFILHADCLVAVATTEWKQSHELSDEAARLVAEAQKLSQSDRQDAARVKTQVADQKRESGKLKIEAARGHVAVATLSLDDFLKSVDSGPSAEQAWTLHAVCGVVQGRQDEVMSSLASLEKTAGNRTDAMQIQIVGTAVHRIAEMTYSIGDWKWAAQLFAQLHALAPMHNFAAAGLSGQAWSQFQLGQFELAAASFSQVVSKHAKHGLAPEAGYMVGDCLKRAGETEKAAAAFSLAAETFAGTYDAYRSALENARLWRKQSDVKKSDVAYQLAYQELLKQPEEKQESLDVLLDEWALLHYESENFKRADQLFELLLSKVPQSNRADNARYSLAESARFAGELDRSKTDFRELEASSKSDRIVQEESLFQLIGIGIEQKDWKAVSTTHDQLTSRFPKSRHRFEAAFFLSDAQLNQNKLVQAEATLIALQQKQDDETVARESWYPHMWVRLAEVFFRRQNYTQVKATVEAFRRWDPESPFFYRAEAILGRSYKNQADKFDEARTAFERVINSKHGRRTETAAKCQLLIAETYYNGEDFEQALLEYLKVDFIYPFPSYQAPALLLAGQCHERLKQKAEAIMQYEELIKKFPKQESATTARERISTLKSNS